MFYENQPVNQQNNYKKMLAIIGNLTLLFSESDCPYLPYRAHENIFCKYLNAENPIKANNKRSISIFISYLNKQRLIKGYVICNRIGTSQGRAVVKNDQTGILLRKGDHVKFRGNTFIIEVKNPNKVCCGVSKMIVDGVEVEGNVLKPTAEGDVHKVTVVLGE